MSLEQVACEDLKAFERRLTEVILHSKPAAFRWRLVLAVVSVSVAVGAVYWLEDTEDGVRIMLEENLLASLPLICAGGHHCCSRERSSEQLIISVVYVDCRVGGWFVVERSEE